MNELKYYGRELDVLKIRVNNCDINALDSIDFFLREANTHTTGISEDVEKQIRKEINRFKKDCICN